MMLDINMTDTTLWSMPNYTSNMPNYTPNISTDVMMTFPVVPNATEPSQSLQNRTDRIIVSVMIFLISFTNITGNSTVILSVIFSKKLRTSTNVFVLSLSVADLLAGLAAPMTTVGLLSFGTSWPWSTEVPCSIAGLLLYISSAASLFNLASIALNRLILIKWPMTLYRSFYTKRNLVINVIIIWIIPICVMTLPPLFGIGGWGYDKQHHSCSDLDAHPRAGTFEVIQAVVSYPAPLIVIVTSYVMIFRHVGRHFKRQKAMHKSVSATTGSSTSGGSSFAIIDQNAASVQSSHLDRISRQQLEITKNLFMAVCAFFVCITPYCVALFIPNNDRYLLYFSQLFFCNSIVNPIVYAAKHPQFKKVMRQIWLCQYSDIEEPSNTLKSTMACCKCI